MRKAEVFVDCVKWISPLLNYQQHLFPIEASVSRSKEGGRRLR